MTQAVELDDERMLGFLRDIVKIESTPGREEPLVDRIAAEMKTLGYADAYIDEAGNAVGRLGEGPPIVLTDCHIDTIPMHSLELWSHDPFGAEIADGRLYGLGVCDMKASAAAVIYGVARLFASAQISAGTVYVVSSNAEEMMEGAVLAATLDRCRPDLVLIGEPTDLRLAIGQRGRAKMEVEITGIASHASHPEVGVNAVEMMARFVDSVAALKHPVHPVLGARTATCIDIHSEPYPSVSMVPSKCRARFDCRFGPDETQESLRALLLAQADVWKDASRPPQLDVHTFVTEFSTFTGQRYRVPEYAPAWLADPGSKVVNACVAALREEGLPSATSIYGFCTNGSLTAGLREIATVGYGIGKEEVAHTVDEYIELEKLFVGARGYAAVVGALLAAGAASRA